MIPALAFHNHQIFKAETAADLRKNFQPELVMENPIDLNAAAWLHGHPNCTIRALVEKFIDRQSAIKLSNQCNNNSVAWFDALIKLAAPIKKDFTSANNGAIKEQHGQRSNTMNDNIDEPKKEEKVKRSRLKKDAKIKKLVENNPRRAGTKGFASWEIMKAGMDVAAYLELGGRMQDLMWEVKKKHVELY